MHEPSDEERERVGKKFAALAAQLRENQAEVAGRKKFVPFTDAELRAFYPPREPAPEPAASEPAP